MEYETCPFTFSLNNGGIYKVSQFVGEVLLMSLPTGLISDGLSVLYDNLYFSI